MEDKAIFLARNGRKGPVWIDVPLNVQNSMVNENNLKRFEAEDDKPSIPDSLIKETIDSINKAERPVFLIGQGVRSAGAVSAFNELAEKYRIPVVFSRFAYDIISTDNGLHFGVVGAGGANRFANFTVQNADLVTAESGSLPHKSERQIITERIPLPEMISGSGCSF